MVALKVCVKKEHFLTEQIYFNIDKYLEDLHGAGFFIFSKQHDFVYYIIDHPEWGAFFIIRKLCKKMCL